MKDNIWKYMNTGYSKKVKCKKYLFEYLNNTNNEFSCYFTIEITNYQNIDDPKLVSE